MHEQIATTVCHLGSFEFIQAGNDFVNLDAVEKITIEPPSDSRPGSVSLRFRSGEIDRYNGGDGELLRDFVQRCGIATLDEDGDDEVVPELKLALPPVDMGPVIGERAPGTGTIKASAPTPTATPSPVIAPTTAVSSPTPNPEPPTPTPAPPAIPTPVREAA